MKVYPLVVMILLVSMVASNGWAQKRPSRFVGFDEGQQGVGLLLGKPTGFRYSYWLNWRRNLMADLAYDFDGILYLHAHYGIYFYNAKDQLKRKQSSNRFLFYVAPGIQAGFRVQGTDKSSSVVLGVRPMGGVEYLFSDAKWSVRAEVGPTVNFIGRTLVGFSGYVGTTYYFGSKKKKASGSSTKSKGRDLEFESEDFKSDTDEDFSDFE